MIEIKEGKCEASWNQFDVAVSIASRISFFSIPASKKLRLFPYANSANQLVRSTYFESTNNIRGKTPHRSQDINSLSSVRFPIQMTFEHITFGFNHIFHFCNISSCKERRESLIYNNDIDGDFVL